MAITVTGLNIYPVKGLKGIALTEATATERGLEHDRRFMIVDDAGMFRTQREHPRLATIWTEIAGDSLRLSAEDRDEIAVPLAPISGPRVRVQVWNSTVDALGVPAADEWLTEYLGMPSHLVYMPDYSRRTSNPKYGGTGKAVGFADGYAYLAANEASLDELNQRLAAKGHPALPMNRFRPNLVVSGETPFGEDHWGEIRVGEAVLRAAKPCGRCQVTTTDQATGEVRGPEPLATLGEYRDSAEFGVMFGMNLVTVNGGRVRVGDEVRSA